MKFETAVASRVAHTSNVKSFRFPRPDAFAYKAGQFMFITIRDGKEELRKHFTISSSPTEDYIEFTKKLSDSRFSSILYTLSVGDWTRIDGPYGRFTFEGEFENIAMLSGGIGITPLRSICKYCTDLHLKTNIVLLYGCRSEKDIAFRGELEDMQDENENLRVIFTVDEPPAGWTGYVGKIDAPMIEGSIPDYMSRTFYTCGPPGMVDAMDTILSDLGVPQDHIKKEHFTGYE